MGAGFQWGCGLSFLGDAQHLSDSDPSTLVLFWAGSWTKRPPESFPASIHPWASLYRLAKAGEGEEETSFICHPSQTKCHSVLSSDLETLYHHFWVVEADANFHHHVKDWLVTAIGVSQRSWPIFKIHHKSQTFFVAPTIPTYTRGWTGPLRLLASLEA